METCELVLKFNKAKMVFKVYEWTRYMEDIETCYQLQEKGSKIQKRMTTRALTGMRLSIAPDVF